MRALLPGLVFATACNQLLGTPEVHPGACDAHAAFVQPAPVGGLDGELEVQGAQLSRDELTVVFSRVTIGRAGSDPVVRRGDLYIAHRGHRGEGFHDAVPLASLNTALDEHGVSLSDDQGSLYFDRQDADRRYRIYLARRASPADPLEPP